MTDQNSFAARADDLRKDVADIEAAPIFTKMKLAQDIATKSALLVADMAARIDAITPFIDEGQE